MAYQISDLLEGLDEATQTQVLDTIEKNSKEKDATVFIQGDGKEFVPKFRLDEVIKERDELKTTVSTNKTELDTLSKQVKDNEQATQTVVKLQEEIEKANEITRRYAIAESARTILASDDFKFTTEAPIEDLLGMIDLSNVSVTESGTVEGLKDKLVALPEAKSYMFKAKEDNSNSNQQRSQFRFGTGFNPDPRGAQSGGNNQNKAGAFGANLAKESTPQTKENQNQWFND